MNPAISADTVAALVRSLFAEDIDQDRKMLGIISQTDVEPYQTALEKERTQTVNYALAETLPPSRFSGSVIGPPNSSELASSSGASSPEEAPGEGIPVEPPPARLGGEPLAAEARAASPSPLALMHTGPELPPGPRPPAVATRPLSQAERRALAEGIPPATTGELVQRHRAPLIAIGGALALGPAVAFAVAYWPEHPPRPVRSTIPVTVEEARDSRSEALDGRGARHREEPAPDLDANGVDATDPAPRAVARRTRPRRPRRSRPKRRVRPPQPAAPSPAQVQRKFLRARREYNAFARAYGSRFEREWQRILFANTYGKKDDKKYKDLDRLLDDLLRKMSRVKRGGG